MLVTECMLLLHDRKFMLVLVRTSMRDAAVAPLLQHPAAFFELQKLNRRLAWTHCLPITHETPPAHCEIEQCGAALQLVAADSVLDRHAQALAGLQLLKCTSSRSRPNSAAKAAATPIKTPSLRTRMQASAPKTSDALGVRSRGFQFESQLLPGKQATVVGFNVTSHFVEASLERHSTSAEHLKLNPRQQPTQTCWLLPTCFLDTATITRFATPTYGKPHEYLTFH